MLMPTDRTRKAHTFAGNGVVRPPSGKRFKGGCFAAGTMIETPNGRVPIEHVGVGGFVIAYDDQGFLAPYQVTETFCHEAQETVKIVLWGGAELIVTPNHWVLTDSNRFLEAGMLDVSMALVGEDGYLLPVVSIEPGPVVEVFNLTVEKVHTFIANGVRVHNKGGGKNAPPPKPPPEPPPPPPAPEPVAKTPETKEGKKRTAGGGKNLDSVRKGTSSLRIQISTPQPSASGLNIPQG